MNTKQVVCDCNLPIFCEPVPP